MVLPSRDDRDARRASFLSAGQEYDAARPDYPLDAIAWAIGEAATVVLDLGCGSGKLTRQLAALGHQVLGIDPSLAMLQAAPEGLPMACGAAEALPLRSRSFDAVTAGTAFHWFDHERAVAEMSRVLHPGGRVGLLWNFRDESIAWVRALSEIIGSEDAMTSAPGEDDAFETSVVSALLAGTYFDEVEQLLFPHTQKLSEDGLVKLVRSRSYIVILPHDERDDVVAAVRRLCGEHPQLKGRDSFEMPYLTRAFRAQAVS